MPATSTNSTNPICSRCRRPLFIISVFPDRASIGYIGLKNESSFVQSGSIFVRGRCQGCGCLNTLQDPHHAIGTAIEEREKQLGLVNVVEVRVVEVRTSTRLAVVGAMR